MDNLHKILTSLDPELSYRIKFACEPSSKDLSKITARLNDRYDAFEIGPLEKTIFQVNPLDFPNLDCGEIWMIDFKCKRPVAPDVLLYEIGSMIQWSESLLHVRSLLDPYEIEMSTTEDDLELDEYLPKITDSSFSDAPEIDPEEYAGQGRADTAVADALSELNKKRSPYAAFLAAGFGKKD